MDNLQRQYIQLELDHHLLVDERDTLVHKFNECQRQCTSIEDEYRSLQETVDRLMFFVILFFTPLLIFFIIFYRNFKMRKN